MGKKKKIRTISLSGFDGGKAKRISDLDINIPCNNYGIVEDLHQSIMHILAQSIRMNNMREKDIQKLIFRYFPRIIKKRVGINQKI